MEIAEFIFEKIRLLPPDKQQEVLRFVESLQRKAAGKRPRRSLRGLWADLAVRLTAEDIAEARREWTR